MSDILPSAARMNAGKKPPRSKPAHSFAMPFVRLNFALI